jgi:hypothetical protein
VRNPLWTTARAVPSLDLRFAENKSLVDATTGAQLVTFTRASSGTFVGSDGVLRTAVTNLQRWSEDFTQGLTPTNATLTANQGIAPNGTLTADQFLETTANGLHVQEIVDHVFIAGVTYTFSCYAKTIGNRNFGPAFPTAFGSARFGFFDLTGSGSVVSTNAGVTASIQAVGDGWYRCSITSTCVTGGGARVGVFIASGTSISYAGDITKGLLLWGAQLEQSSTVGEYIPTTSTINSAPRFDHNPTTGESLGLLVEEARTNSIRNNTMVGAVAGTPGTVPTNWSVAAAAGLTTNVIGTGTSQGVTYVDLQVTGTSNATSYILAFDATTQIAATAGQSWSWSSWLAFVSGSLSDISTVSADFRESNSGGTQLAAGTVALSTLTSNLVRLSATRVLSEATTAFVQPRLRLTITNGAAIDITLRIGLPQLEQGAFVTSVIPTSTTAVTRSADVCSISGSNFSSWYRQDEGTVFTEASTFGNAATGGILRLVNSDDTGKRIRLSYTSGTNLVYTVVDSTTQASATLAAGLTINTSNKSAAAYQVDNFAGSVNGLAPVLDTLGTVPSSLNSVQIGVDGSAVTTILNGTIRRLVFWGQRLPNNILQTLTQ